jgi:hypothetical protein
MQNLRDECDLHLEYEREFFSYDEVWSWFNISLK